jgi:hypothetical protein
LSGGPCPSYAPRSHHCLPRAPTSFSRGAGLPPADPGAPSLQAGVLAHPAAAIEPTRVPIDETDIYVVEDICSFPITITATVVGTETTFYDQSGEVTRIHDHVVEQDVFSADGESLTGLPFTFNIFRSCSRTARSRASMPAASSRGSRCRTGPCSSRPAVWTSPPIRDPTSASCPMSDAQEMWPRSVRRLQANH